MKNPKKLLSTQRQKRREKARERLLHARHAIDATGEQRFCITSSYWKAQGLSWTCAQHARPPKKLGELSHQQTLRRKKRQSSRRPTRFCRRRKQTGRFPLEKAARLPRDGRDGRNEGKRSGHSTYVGTYSSQRVRTYLHSLSV